MSFKEYFILSRTLQDQVIYLNIVIFQRYLRNRYFFLILESEQEFYPTSKP